MLGVRWAEFEQDAPELALAASTLFARYEVVLLGTNRTDGYPRLSLVEPVVLDGDLLIGTRADDVKTKDLRRDPRCSMHTLVRHRTHHDGEFKAQLQGTEVSADARKLDALSRPEFDWVPTAVFTLSIVRATLIETDGIKNWSPA